MLLAALVFASLSLVVSALAVAAAHRSPRELVKHLEDRIDAAERQLESWRVRHAAMVEELESVFDKIESKRRSLAAIESKARRAQQANGQGGEESVDPRTYYTRVARERGLL